MADDYSDVVAAGFGEEPKPRKVVRGMEKLQGVQPELIDHWNNLQTEFDKAGLSAAIKSGYRTAEQQNSLHRRGYPTKGNDGYVNISPHQEGRALDISFSGPQKAKGRAIIANYAKQNGLYIPSDEPWHIALPKTKQAETDYNDVLSAAFGDEPAAPKTPEPADSYADVVDAATPKFAKAKASVTATRAPSKPSMQSALDMAFAATHAAARYAQSQQLTIADIRMADNPAIGFNRAQGQPSRVTQTEDELRVMKGEQPSDRQGYARQQEAQARLGQMKELGLQQFDPVKEEQWHMANEREITALTKQYKDRISKAGKRNLVGGQWGSEVAAKGLAGWGELLAGASGSDALRINSEAMQQAAMELGANRNQASRLVNDVVGGFVASAPELGAMTAGAPPVTVFSTAGALRAGGTGHDPNVGALHGGATGLTFEAPALGEGLMKPITKGLGVGVASTGVELASGASLYEALTTAATNALMSGGPEAFHAVGEINAARETALKSPDTKVERTIENALAPTERIPVAPTEGVVNDSTVPSAPTTPTKVRFEGVDQETGEAAKGAGRVVSWDTPGMDLESPEMQSLRETHTPVVDDGTKHISIVPNEWIQPEPTVSTGTTPADITRIDTAREAAAAQVERRATPRTDKGTIEAEIHERLTRLGYTPEEQAAMSVNEKAAAVSGDVRRSPNRVSDEAWAAMSPEEQAAVKTQTTNFPEPTAPATESTAREGEAIVKYDRATGKFDEQGHAITEVAPQKVGQLVSLPEDVTGVGVRVGRVTRVGADGKPLDVTDQSGKFYYLKDGKTFDADVFTDDPRRQVQPSSQPEPTAPIEERRSHQRAQGLEVFDPEQRAFVRDAILNAHPDDLDNMKRIMAGAMERIGGEPAAESPAVREGAQPATDEQVAALRRQQFSAGDAKKFTQAEAAKLIERGIDHETFFKDAMRLRRQEGVASEDMLAALIKQHTGIDRAAQPSPQAEAVAPESQSATEGEPNVAQEAVAPPTGRSSTEEAVGEQSIPAAPSSPTVGEPLVHPNPEHHGKEVIAIDSENRAVVATPENKGGVSRLKTTAPKDASMQADRAELGLPELEQVPHVSSQEVLDKAKAANDADPRAANELIDAAIAGGKNYNNTETMQVNLRGQEIKNRIRDIHKEIYDAADPQVIAEKRAVSDALLAEYDRVSEAQDKAGAEWSRAGTARQRAIRDDFSLVEMIARRKKAKGDVLTPEEQGIVEKQYQQIEDLQAKLTEAEERANLRNSQQETAKFVREQQLQVRKSRRNVSRETLRTERADLKAQFKTEWAKSGPKSRTLSMAGLGDLDPEGTLSKIAAKLARNYIEDGTIKVTDLVDSVHNDLKDVADLTKREVSDLISGYGRVKQPTKDATERKLNEIKSILAAQSGKADVVEQGIRPLRRGQQREKPTEDQRRALRELNEAMRERPEISAKPASATEQATPLDKAKTTTRNRIEQLKTWIADGKREVQGKSQIIPDAELNRLKAERDALEKVAAKLSDPAADERAIDARVRELNKAVSEAERKLKAGETSTAREGAKSAWSPEIARLTKERDTLRKVAQDIRAAKAKTTEPTAPFYGATGSWAEYEAAARKSIATNKAAQTRMEKQIAEMERQMASGNFSKPQRQPPKYNRETYDLQKRIDKVKQQYNKALYKATRSRGGRISDELAKAANVPKTIKSMGDVSAVFRQGGYYAITHPINGFQKPMADMLRSFTEVGYKNVENAIRSHPKFEQAKRDGVEFTGVDKDDPNLSKHEEGYLGSEYLDYVPIAKQIKDFSERTFVSFLDSQRMSMYDTITDGLTKPSRLNRLLGAKEGRTAEQLKGDRERIAKAINSATGRGNLGTKGNQAAPLLNLAMFSPRLLKSRVELLNNMLNPVAIARMPRNARAQIIADNVKFVGATLAVMGLAKSLGATVNTDPDDGDFLKIRAGNTTYDTLTGLQQPFRYIINMKRAMTGYDSPWALGIGGEDYTGKSAWEQTVGTPTSGGFIESKASPLAGGVIESVRGSDFTGRKRTVAERAIDIIKPLPAKDVMEAFKQDGIIGALKTLPTLTGIGVATYPPPTEEAKTHAEKLARKFVRDSIGKDSARTEEEIDKDRKKAQLRARSRAGEDVYDEAEKLDLTPRQMNSILESQGQTRLEEDLRQLSPRKALTVWSVMTPEQRETTRPIMEQKAGTIGDKPAAERDQLQKDFDKAGITSDADGLSKAQSLGVPMPIPAKRADESDVAYRARLLQVGHARNRKLDAVVSRDNFSTLSQTRQRSLLRSAAISV